MKILFLCNFYHNAMIFYDLKSALEDLGHEVKVFNAVKYGTEIKKKYEKIMDDPAVLHKECFGKYDRCFYFYKQRKICKALEQSVNIGEFDLIHSHMLFSGGYVARKLKKKYKIPFFVSVRNTDLNCFLKIPFFKIIANKIAEDASGVLFLSKPYHKEFQNKHLQAKNADSFKNKSGIFYNGLEKFWLDNVFDEKKSKPKEYISILYAGNIEKKKNITTTLDACKLLIKAGRRVKFTIVGEVKDKSLFDIITKERFVKYVAFSRKEELLNIYRENHIFVMPSVHETFGRAYAEAMSQGLPVIYSRNQGFDGIFSEGDAGYSVPYYDEESIAEAVLKIIDNYEEMSMKCVENARIFDWKVIAENMEAFYSRQTQNPFIDYSDLIK